MIRLQIVSDVHTEFHRDGGIDWASRLPVGSTSDGNEIDALVIAGDYGNWPFCTGSMKVLCARFPRIIYVAGNHEYYGSSFKEVQRQIRIFEKENKNFDWLNNRMIKVAGQRILGTSLWFPETQETRKFRSCMSDFQSIRDAQYRIYDENQQACEFLKQEMCVDDVVITHHLPSYECVSERFKGSKLNCYFVSPLDDLINDRGPKLWIHGHTHDSKDFFLTRTKTRIVCNPFGYVGLELNPIYEEPKIIEI